MQDIARSPALGHQNDDTAQPRSIVISVEMIIYLLLIGLAAALRFAELNTIPLSERESMEALAAWRAVYPGAAGADPLIASSALNFITQALSFSLLGGDEFSSRFFVALAGTALTFAPLLFRGWLGHTRTLMFCLLLAASPILLLTSRSASPVIWSLGCTVLMLWGICRWQMTRQTAYAVAGTVGAAGLLFLSEGGGIILFAIIAVSLIAAQIMTRRADARYTFEEDDAVAESEPAAASSWLRLPADFPWSMALPAAGLISAALATGFLLYPQGFAVVGESLADFFRGLSQPTPGSTFLYPLVMSVFYELFFWVFALVSIVYLVQTFRITFIERFFIAWLVCGVAASIIFPGALADHALWFVVPLCGLIAPLLERMLQPDDRLVEWASPYWVRGLLALIVLGLMLAFTLALHVAARSLMSLETLGDLFADGRGALNFLAAIALLGVGILSFIVSVVIWNGRTAMRGFGLGLLIFGLVTSLGAGWNAAVANAERPTVFWQTSTISSDTFLLRRTLLDLAARRSRGFTQMPLTVVGPSNGPIAWLVRDFDRARFVPDLAEARGADIVLVAPATTIITDLGGPYVGQDFTLRRSWDASTLRLTEVLAWWTQGRTRFDVTGLQNAELWLRQDVYDGTTQTVIAG